MNRDREPEREKERVNITACHELLAGYRCIELPPPDVHKPRTIRACGTTVVRPEVASWEQWRAIRGPIAGWNSRESGPRPCLLFRADRSGEGAGETRENTRQVRQHEAQRRK